MSKKISKENPPLQKTYKENMKMDKSKTSRIKKKKLLGETTNDLAPVWFVFLLLLLRTVRFVGGETERGRCFPRDQRRAVGSDESQTSTHS